MEWLLNRRSRMLLYRDLLSVGGLEDLTLGRVVPEQLLDQVDVGEQHAAAAVAGESQFVERLTVHCLRQRSFPGLFSLVLDIPFGHTLATIGVNQLDVFGPKVTDDLSRISLVSRANLEFCLESVSPCRTRSSAQE